MIRAGKMMLRNAELDHAAEIAIILEARRPLVEADRVAAAGEVGDWLSLAEIARLRPPGSSRERRAVRQAIRRAAERWPVETRMRGNEVIIPSAWLTERRLIGGTRTTPR